MGYQVRRNDPYAGGYVTRHYGRPREGTHALQIEIARPLYMDERPVASAAAGSARLQQDLYRASRPSWPGRRPELLRGRKKKAAPCGTAKFREETSKRQGRSPAASEG